MSDAAIRQRRDGAVLCEVDRNRRGSPRFFDGADASSAAFAFAVSAIPNLPRDDVAIATAWSSRLVRRAAGSDAVRAYDESGEWTREMEEAFAGGFVAFLRSAAWGKTWPPNAEPWRRQTASTMAACHETDDASSTSQGLDETIGALYGRLAGHAADRNALPFGAPAPMHRPPYAEPDSSPIAAAAGGDASASRRRKASVVVGEDVAEIVSPSASARDPLFADVAAPEPRRFAPALAIVAGSLVVAALGMWLLYALVLRPGERDAQRESDVAIERLAKGKFSDVYQEAAPRLRTEKWKDFAGRLVALENLGKLEADDVRSNVTIQRDPSLGRTATVDVDAGYTFGRAHVSLRYVDVGFAGEWRLAQLDLETHPDVAEPPFPATDAGADALARRMLYAFQCNDFATIDGLLSSAQAHARLAEFRKELLGDGHITLVDRLSFDTQSMEGIDVRVATYRIETSREHRAGTIALALTAENGVWVTRQVESNMNYWQ